MKPKIIFFGSDKYSDIVLQTLKEDPRFEIIKAIKDKNSLQKLKTLSLQADVGIIASFGVIIPSDIILMPKFGILNIHPSLLPKYRGPSPVQQAIINGEKQTGVTIIKIDEKADHGPILAQSVEDIYPEDTTESLYFRLFKIGSQTLKTILPAYSENRIDLRKQNHSQATYTKRLTRDDGKIDWQKSDTYNERFIRAMFPWPGAWTLLRPNQTGATEGQAKRLKILKAHLENNKLVLDTVQLEGKKPVSWKQFFEGYPQAQIIT